MTNRIEKSNLAKTSNKNVVIPQLKSTTPADMAVFLQEAFEAVIQDILHFASVLQQKPMMSSLSPQLLKTFAKWLSFI